MCNALHRLACGALWQVGLKQVTRLFPRNVVALACVQELQASSDPPLGLCNEDGEVDKLQS